MCEHVHLQKIDRHRQGPDRQGTEGLESTEIGSKTYKNLYKTYKNLCKTYKNLYETYQNIQKPMSFAMFCYVFARFC